MRMTAALGLVVALTCVPAFAEEGNVSSATLRALGLGGAEVLSDAQGMEVRGMASSASASGTSLIFGQLTDNNGNFVVASDTNSFSTSQSTGNTRSRRRSGSGVVLSGAIGGQGSALDVGLQVDNGTSVFSGGFGGIGGGGGFAFGGYGRFSGQPVP